MRPPPLQTNIRLSWYFASLKFLTETCPAGWSLFNKYCYKTINFTMRKNWSDARETCLNINSDLVSIKNEEENRFVATFFTGQLAWIGLRHGERVWSDGSNATYFGSPGLFNSTPTGLCCVLTFGLQWSVKTCDIRLEHAVCKRMGLYRAPEATFITRSVSSLDQLYATIIN